MKGESWLSSMGNSTSQVGTKFSNGKREKENIIEKNATVVNGKKNSRDDVV